ncbi:MAG: AMP-binding protein [Acidimicrobiia bacterium]
MARRPGATALIADGYVHSFTAIDRESDRLACALQSAGIRRGDRVAVMLENSPELVVSLFGILKAGGVFVPVNPTMKAHKLAYILSQCGVSCLVVHSRIARVIVPALVAAPTVGAAIWIGGLPAGAPFGLAFEEVMQAPASPVATPGLIDADLGAIIYTSGTTGDPKGVMLTHRTMRNNAWAISTYLANVPDDVVVCALPMAFSYGLFQVLAGARVGYAVLIERSFAYPRDVMHRVAQYRVTGFPGVPAMFAAMVQVAPFDDLDLSHLRYLTNAAAPIAPAHIRRLQELFPQADIFSMYGLTECTRVSYLDPARLTDKISSVGTAMPNTEVYIVDEYGHRVPPGEVGELVVRGANVMRGYWGKPEETAERLRDGEISGEKVLHTGDQFRMDDEGLLYFVGRTDDMFMCRGEKISPKEIENVLYELEAVSEAAVVGVPDPVEGMAIKATVVPRDGVTLTDQQVRLHCRDRLETSRVPKLVEIRESLPKTESGKIKRSALSQA